jgi:hydrogenase maturation protease
MNEWEWRLLDERTTLGCVSHDGGELAAGTRVRLKPRARGGDALDLLFAGKTAIIESIEQDYEGAVHLALVFDDDPGRDLGLLRQPGHRFFYAPDEVERCAPGDVESTAAEPPPEAAAPSILIAGIGNIFLGDDGFGVAVADRLSASVLPAGVRVKDYGIRGLDLAYALLDAPDVTILIDACPRGEAPGTLFVIEPEIGGGDAAAPSVPDAHAMNPLLVIRMAQSMGGDLKRILLVGCEPATLGPEEGQLGLSDQVEAAVDEAVALVLALVREIRDGGWPAGSRQPAA